MATDLSGMRNLYREGHLTAAFITPANVPHGWLLTCIRKDGSHEQMTIAKSSRIKIYKSLESVHLDAKRVGFATVTTEVEKLEVA